MGYKNVRLQRKYRSSILSPGEINIVPRVIVKYLWILSHDWSITEVISHINSVIRYGQGKAVCLHEEKYISEIIDLIFFSIRENVSFVKIF